MDDFRRAASELNGIGKKTKAAGIQMGFHNHHMEFEMRGDDLVYDVLSLLTWLTGHQKKKKQSQLVRESLTGLISLRQQRPAG